MTKEQIQQMEGLQPEVKDILLNLVERVETLEGAGA